MPVLSQRTANKMKMTIDLTDEQIKYLKQFAVNQHEGAEDNACTSKPLHLVQTQEEEYIHDGGGNGDYDVYIDADNPDKVFRNALNVVLEYGVYDNPDDVIDYNATCYGESINGNLIYDLDDYFDAYGITANIERCSVIKKYRTVAYFFILENARQYMKSQAHNLHNPRTFTVYRGYGNDAEYEPFFDLLMSIGSKLNTLSS